MRSTLAWFGYQLRVFSPEGHRFIFIPPYSILIWNEAALDPFITVLGEQQPRLRLPTYQ